MILATNVEGVLLFARLAMQDYTVVVNKMKIAGIRFTRKYYFRLSTSKFRFNSMCYLSFFVIISEIF